MTLALAMILLGIAIVYGGWTNRAIFTGILIGDDTKVKPTVPTNTTGIRTAS